jgi:hypothetical protein
MNLRVCGKPGKDMALIRVIYEAEPDFPVHPDAVRYQVGDYWIDALGGDSGTGDQVPVDQILPVDLQDLGRVLYEERREKREGLARAIIERAKKPR